MKDIGNLYLAFKMNGNKNMTTNGKLNRSTALVKEHLCLFNQEYNPVEVMKGGRTFYAKASQVSSFITW